MSEFLFLGKLILWVHKNCSKNVWHTFSSPSTPCKTFTGRCIPGPAVPHPTVFFLITNIVSTGHPPFPAHHWPAGRPGPHPGIWTWCPPAPSSPPCPSAGSFRQSSALWVAYPAACSSACCTPTWCTHYLEEQTHGKRKRRHLIHLNYTSRSLFIVAVNWI